MSDYTKTLLSNLAINHLNYGKEIQDFDNDQTAEARACRRFLDITVDEILRKFPWPFATKLVALALVEENPTSEWKYAYRHPADSLMLRRIPSGCRNDTRASRVPYRVVGDETGKLIYTDRDSAEMEYTSVLGRDPGRWDADFLTAASFRLAAYVAPAITAGDPYKLGDRSFQLWRMSNGLAQANAANEEQAEDIPLGELQLARY